MAGELEWNEELSDCCKDGGICCCGFFCTPCLFGKNAEKIDGSSCVGWTCMYWCLASSYLCWIPHMMKRKKLREKYNLKPSPDCDDCCTVTFCGPCAICQEAREMKSREGGSVAYNSGGGPAVVTQPGSKPPNERV